jgi:hypothetical protein
MHNGEILHEKTAKHCFAVFFLLPEGLREIGGVSRLERFYFRQRSTSSGEIS